jgi:hypothetical protein
MILVEHEYHIVELYRTTPEMFEWLMLKFGPGDGKRWMYKPPSLYFADPKDHLIFCLRWS